MLCWVIKTNYKVLNGFPEHNQQIRQKDLASCVRHIHYYLVSYYT